MIGVVGAGAWGTALAGLLGAREPVRLWYHRTRPEARAGVAPTAELSDLAACDVVLMATPLQRMRGVLAAMPPVSTLVLCSKGIEAGSARLPHEIAAEIMPGSRCALLSGPTFAHDVLAGRPVAATLACVAEDSLLPRLARPGLRLYLSGDLPGVAVGGAVKNVIAIACGVVSGCGLGESARAAVVSRGLAEMVRYAVARGGRAETLAGLSGLGDLVLTCGSANSRNMALGEAIGRGGDVGALLRDRSTVAEGAATAPVLAADARARGVEMPITDAVAALIAGTATPAELVERLLGRALRAE